jgi:hypothetical protein
MQLPTRKLTRFYSISWKKMSASTSGVDRATMQCKQHHSGTVGVETRAPITKESRYQCTREHDHLHGKTLQAETAAGEGKTTRPLLDIVNAQGWNNVYNNTTLQKLR